MVISRNTQLGLRMADLETYTDLLLTYRQSQKIQQEDIQNSIDFIRTNGRDEEVMKDFILGAQDDIEEFDTEERVNEIHDGGGFVNIIDNASGQLPKYFYICETVYKAAELIKIGHNFTGTIMRKIKPGRYCYLMGKNRTVAFTVKSNAILGIYYDDAKKHILKWGIDTVTGKYFMNLKSLMPEFSQVMQLMTFIELGDIEVVMLEGGRNNGGKRNVDKITNLEKNTVFVVDSSWNKLMIRTDGFAVRGHFRLQACGEGLADRKLIWINAFEKHGYVRQPKAKILND